MSRNCNDMDGQGSCMAANLPLVTCHQQTPSVTMPSQPVRRDVGPAGATTWSMIAGLAMAVLVLIVLAAHALARTTT